MPRLRSLAVLAAPAALLTLGAAAPPAVAPMPPAARDTDPVCNGAAGPAVPVTGGTVSWCQTADGGRLTFRTTGPAATDLSLVVYDCDGGKAPAVDAVKCAATLRSTRDIVWRHVEPQQSVHADLALPRGSNAQVWWTADTPDRATDLRLLGTPWNS
ncbi:hypothetical protein [Streptomyces sp. TLI_171]|uniref:hypothetical protein n=1 Tax=Streptomyces sp. TLI_171 TaxID=1938859 RepID=UPI000C19B825|nr:hypothetical protein [Streptomyces sp. TLI_171]RKE16907.1 hypothetical protein BX266_0153 [Streptomyces sp. TLI_171]